MLDLKHSEFAAMDAVELTDGFRSKEFTPVEVAKSLLERVEQINPLINAFVHVDADTTLDMAHASTERWSRGEELGPLDGVPITIKDLVGVAGWPLRRGSEAFPSDNIPAEDAPCVARLREAGAIFLGKTSTPDAGSKITTRSDVHGETANPYDLTKTPGGSSGGASAALASGLAPLAVGTDGAGSIRIPAAYCNLFGIKPSFGRVSIHPQSLFMPHSVIGPMGRRVWDTALMLDVMSTPDPRDPYAIQESMALSSDYDLTNLKIGLTWDFGMGSPALPSDTVRAIQSSVKALEAAGASIEEVEIKWPVDPFKPFMVFWEATYTGYLDSLPQDRRDSVNSDLRAIAARGESVDITAYHRAMGERLALTSAAHALFNGFDLIVGPVNLVHPYQLGQDWPDGVDDEWSWCPFTYIWNMTDHPAASAPAGFTQDGLPIGLQLVAPKRRETLLVRASLALETSSDFAQRSPDWSKSDK